MKKEQDRPTPEQLRAERIRAGISTQAALGERWGLSRETVSRMERSAPDGSELPGWLADALVGLRCR